MKIVFNPLACLKITILANKDFISHKVSYGMSHSTIFPKLLMQLARQTGPKHDSSPDWYNLKSK